MTCAEAASIVADPQSNFTTVVTKLDLDVGRLCMAERIRQAFLGDPVDDHSVSGSVLKSPIELQMNASTRPRPEARPQASRAPRRVRDHRGFPDGAARRFVQSRRGSSA